jgi:polysaccharide export outer membrane protein
VRTRTLLLVTACLLVVLPILSAQEVSRDYRVGPKDLLEIRVFGHDEMNTETRVTEDGTITLHLVGEVEVEGLTKVELEKRLEELLGEKYYQNPQVTVFIREYQSKIVSVMGAVRNPGDYELIGRQTLMQILAKAGGTTGEEGQEIIIFRQLPNGTSTSLKISTKGLMVDGDPELNLPLVPGDVINIPIDKTVNIFVYGQVRNPGALDVKESDLPDYTLLKAIAQAGGFSDRASKGGVFIIRKDENGKEQKIKVNVKDIEKRKIPDVSLKEGDVINVPERIF